MKKYRFCLVSSDPSYPYCWTEKEGENAQEAMRKITNVRSVLGFWEVKNGQYYTDIIEKNGYKMQ